MEPLTFSRRTEAEAARLLSPPEPQVTGLDAREIPGPPRGRLESAPPPPLSNLPWAWALPGVLHAMQLIDTQEVQGELHVYLSQQGSNQVWVCRPVRMCLIPADCGRNFDPTYTYC